MGVIMVSAKNTRRDIDYAMRNGADDYVTKPYSPQDLLRRIKVLTSRPNFRIRPKRRTLNEIIEMEYLHDKDRDDQGAQLERRRKYHEMREILDAEYHRTRERDE
jgi:DNA-binding response OmpR family regulator